MKVYIVKLFSVSDSVPKRCFGAQNSMSKACVCNSSKKLCMCVFSQHHIAGQTYGDFCLKKAYSFYSIQDHRLVSFVICGFLSNHLKIHNLKASVFFRLPLVNVQLSEPYIITGGKWMAQTVLIFVVIEMPVRSKKSVMRINLLFTSPALCPSSSILEPIKQNYLLPFLLQKIC